MNTDEVYYLDLNFSELALINVEALTDNETEKSKLYKLEYNYEKNF